MSLTLRPAYEKVLRSQRTVRRGRLPEVPVEIYHELDNITKRLDALALLSGAGNDAIGALTKSSLFTAGIGAPPPTGEDTESRVVETFDSIAFVASSDTAADPSVTVSRTIKDPFIILTAQIEIEIGTGDRFGIEQRLLVAAGGDALTNVNNVLLGPPNAPLDDAGDGVFLARYQFGLIDGNSEAREIGFPFSQEQKGRVFAAGSRVQFKVSAGGGTYVLRNAVLEIVRFVRTG